MGCGCKKKSQAVKTETNTNQQISTVKNESAELVVKVSEMKSDK